MNSSGTGNFIPPGCNFLHPLRASLAFGRKSDVLQKLEAVDHVGTCGGLALIVLRKVR